MARCPQHFAARNPPTSSEFSHRNLRPQRISEEILNGDPLLAAIEITTLFTEPALRPLAESHSPW
jgi:hypothetical protein